MRVVAIYNMKGGVGKTTTAVNLSHCGGSRPADLLWDLDPQAASSFAFRMARVAGFDRKSLRLPDARGGHQGDRLRHPTCCRRTSPSQARSAAAPARPPEARMTAS
jgi:cellulose biosynthesis protein BcsQ